MVNIVIESLSPFLESDKSIFGADKMEAGTELSLAHLIFETLKNSALLPIIGSFLVGTSLLDVMKNRTLYMTLFRLVELFCRESYLVPLLAPSMFGETSKEESKLPSIVSMVKSMGLLADSIVRQVRLGGVDWYSKISHHNAIFYSLCNSLKKFKVKFSTKHPMGSLN
jgi:hypothetical protein